MAKTYIEQQVEQQRRSAEQFDRMSRMPTRPKRVTAQEMAACEAARKKGEKR
jgi:hypothetical protein